MSTIPLYHSQVWISLDHKWGFFGMASDSRGILRPQFFVTAVSFAPGRFLFGPRPLQFIEQLAVIHIEHAPPSLTFRSMSISPCEVQYS